jgi:hypothetical protein
MRYLRVEDDRALVRDVQSNAILNTDLSSIKKHDVRMKKIQKERMQQDEINTLKNDISELRDLITTLLSR